MPFVVECPYCRLRARVPDRSLGASGKCPRCAGAFTLAPAEDQHVPELAGVSADPSSSDLEPASSDLEPAGTASFPEGLGENDSVVEEAIRRSAQDLSEADAEPDEVPADAPRAAAPQPGSKASSAAGAAALMLGGLALVSASARVSCVLVLPASGLGLLVGVIAIALAGRGKGRRRFLLPASAAAACGVLCGLAWLNPALLGPNYERSRLPYAPTTGVRAVPLAGPMKIATAPDWADASKYALQQGDLRVQVVGVSVGPVDAKAKPAAPEFLLVRLRMTRTSGHPGEAKPIDWTDKNGPTLKDQAGRSYAFNQSKAALPVGAKRRADLFPVQTGDEVLAFEKPAAAWDMLRLEVPGSAMQANGTFRFSLPASLLAAPKPGGKE